MMARWTIWDIVRNDHSILASSLRHLMYSVGEKSPERLFTLCCTACIHVGCTTGYTYAHRKLGSGRECYGVAERAFVGQAEVSAHPWSVRESCGNDPTRSQVPRV